MYVKKECIAMLLAGGQGSRLYDLTKKIAKHLTFFFIFDIFRDNQFGVFYFSWEK